MDMSFESAQGIKRIRQARKKTKCSGERPICFHCRRNRIACLYEPYSATIVAEPNQPAQPLPTSNNYQDSSNVCSREPLYEASANSSDRRSFYTE
ncbi:hypothetical protein N7509_008507 [Penicillium cosmopolitanum]|uniref:Zn(2)-C6 fungal-type domain-containing protein n=1 Tax=Penicillium cosmopolitanum TaxID=1131564 RepID=A0A9W9VMP5_9EURO|nr:uncharacterized protein N7509_008507 [Penicillium cosmopolitanum]KAJ5385966.1 hypothetical protein N7509_008507 [Penicillium cosmopolitanum]